jgi:hypothetical protein
MLINEQRLEKAMNYLVDTDFECANYKVDAERWKYIAKRNKAHVILAETGTAQVKDARAEITQVVSDAEDAYFDCLRLYEQMSAKRKTEQLVIEVWRTEQANLRKG